MEKTKSEASVKWATPSGISTQWQVVIVGAAPNTTIHLQVLTVLEFQHDKTKFVEFLGHDRALF